MLMQAIRYHYWQDPGEELHGHESKCELADKMFKLTGSLPAGMLVQRYERCMAQLQLYEERKKKWARRDAEPAPVAENLRPGRMKARRVRRRGAMYADQQYSSLGRLRPGTEFSRGPEGNGRHGQWTRWGGFG